MEIPAELTAEVIACWLTTQRFASPLKLPEMSLGCLERLLRTPHPAQLAFKLHTALLNTLIDAKRVQLHPGMDVNRLTWSHQIGLAIQHAESLPPDLSRCEPLSEACHLSDSSGSSLV